MDDAPLYLVWLTLHDGDFLAEHAHALDSHLLPPGALRGLSALALDHYRETRRPTTRQVLEVRLGAGWNPEPHGTDAESMLDVYDTLDVYEVDEEAREPVVEGVLSWLRLRRLGHTLDEATRALERRDEEAVTRSLHAAQRAVTPPVEELVLEDIDVLYDGRDLDRTPTGIPFIDRSWSGGPAKHEMGVVLASTSVGKSQTLCYFAATAYKDDRRVLYYTFELSPRAVLARIAAALLRRPVHRVSVDQARHVLQVMRDQRGIDRGWIRIRGGAYTVEDLRRDLIELDRDGEKPDLVLIDSPDDLQTNDTRGQLWEQVARVYRSLRHLTIEQGVTLWASSQTKIDAIERARISLKHINFLSKAQRAHYVLGLAQTPEQKTDSFGPLLNLYILKDSEHGSAGRNDELRVTFGTGDDGYPGFEGKDPDDPTA